MKQYDKHVADVRAWIKQWREARKPWYVRFFNSLKLKSHEWYNKR